MPRINLRRRSQPRIGEMRDLVWVCTTVEKPDDDVSTVVERPGVFRAHARVRSMRPDEIMDYMAVFGSQDRATVEVTVRYPPDCKIDLGHWIYSEGDDTKTWLKVRGVTDMGNAHRFLILACSIDTVNDRRSDPATQQPPPIWEVPVYDDAPL